MKNTNINVCERVCRYCDGWKPAFNCTFANLFCACGWVTINLLLSCYWPTISTVNLVHLTVNNTVFWVIIQENCSASFRVSCFFLCFLTLSSCLEKCCIFQLISWIYATEFLVQLFSTRSLIFCPYLQQLWCTQTHIPHITAALPIYIYIYILRITTKITARTYASQAFNTSDKSAHIAANITGHYSIEQQSPYPHLPIPGMGPTYLDDSWFVLPTSMRCGLTKANK